MDGIVGTLVHELEACATTGVTIATGGGDQEDADPIVIKPMDPVSICLRLHIPPVRFYVSSERNQEFRRRLYTIDRMVSDMISGVATAVALNHPSQANVRRFAEVRDSGRWTPDKSEDANGAKGEYKRLSPEELQKVIQERRRQILALSEPLPTLPTAAGSAAPVPVPISEKDLLALANTVDANAIKVQEDGAQA